MGGCVGEKRLAAPSTFRVVLRTWSCMNEACLFLLFCILFQEHFWDSGSFPIQGGRLFVSVLGCLVLFWDVG